MTHIIEFPIANNLRGHDYDADIDEILASIPPKSREKLRFELIKTIDSYDTYFTQWSLSFPEGCDETLRKQIYDLAHQEHGRKMRMLKDIMRLKAMVLVSEFHKSR
ncbi:hypothetical protein [Azonexus sp. IMCC34839]|uniref:hypothetical protein n=1 Tax=Azonexus sp. IMCC34839 TaxID=3133695 RepID=UPI00399968D7